MGIFGSSYPPGCNGTPWDEDVPCDVCGGWDIYPRQVTATRKVCICEECPECGEKGDPACYKPREQSGHGLVVSKAQSDQLAAQQALWEAEGRADAVAEAAYHASEQVQRDEAELNAFYDEFAKENQ